MASSGPDTSKHDAARACAVTPPGAARACPRRSWERCRAARRGRACRTTITSHSPSAVSAVGRHHHLAAGEAAVVERDEGQRLSSSSGPPSTRERDGLQREPRHRDEHAEAVAGLAEALEAAVGHRAHVGHEAEAEQVDVVECRPARWRRRITSQGRCLPLDQGAPRVGGALGGEVAQERVAGAERQKAERGALARLERLREQAVDDLEAGAVAADRDEVAHARGDRPSRAMRGRLAGGPRLLHLDVEARLRASARIASRRLACRSDRRRRPD